MEITKSFFMRLYKNCKDKVDNFGCTECFFLDECREVFYSIPEEMRLDPTPKPSTSRLPTKETNSEEPEPPDTEKKKVIEGEIIPFDKDNDYPVFSSEIDLVEVEKEFLGKRVRITIDEVK